MPTRNDTAADREISATRVVDDPRGLVWKVWTDPKHVAQWWGPNGFTNTIHQMDVRPGGTWRLTMHGPDGRDYPNESRFVEVTEPERIVFDHLSTPGFQMTVTFTERGGQTEVTMRMVFATDQDRDMAVNKFGAVEGLTQNLAKLGDYLTR
jgi:uncharacterized protein YndB with AHSA1/START domain